MAKKLWGGAFEKAPNEELLGFLSKEDVEADASLLEYDIQGSLAHVCMLSRQKILPKEEAKAILSALISIRKKVEEGKFFLDPSLEDAHTNIEAEVTKLTPYGKKMHIARSRNDQVSLDMRLYMRDAVNEVSQSLLDLQKSLALLSKKDCPFPSYTHFQVAQPASLLFWCHAHWHGLERDLSRLGDFYKRLNQNPLGSGAIAGSGWEIDRHYTSRLLGFDLPTANPMDTVSSRGELEAELLYILSLAMVHASRIAEDIILYSNKRLIVLPDEFSTGSSMMPQKKNPDPCELVRGKASRVLGLAFATASISKGLPTGFNRDTQETKPALMEGVEATLASLRILAKLLPSLQLNRERILLELEEGYASATSLADLLAKKGVPFREAHEMVGKLVRSCIAQKKFLSQLSAEEVSAIGKVKISPKELAEAVSVDKTANFSAKYKIPKQSNFAKLLAERKKRLALAERLLEKEVRKIIE
ncbi:MAG: argininosuccinate lyase [Candidatus Micrarchaeota archaeon]|nr:argininosuccinate lyase [Candidatus Micrarchaeota archaeon]